MKKLICATSVIAMAMVQGAGGAAATAAGTARSDTVAGVAALTAQSFRDPAAADRPWVRWNLGPQLTEAEMALELRQIRDAGIAGVEVGQGDVYPSQQQIGFILRTANALGLKVSLFAGPFNAPAGFSIDDDQARKTLTWGAAFVDGSAAFSGALPTPQGVARKSLVAVQAYKVVGPCAANASCVLDESSRVDVTARVVPTARAGVAGAISDGRLDWTPPSAGNWIILAMWSVGYAAQPDLLTPAGTKVLTDSLDRFVAPFAAEWKRNGGDIFYDSHSEWRGDPAETWSLTMARDFAARRGYALTPYLPLLLRLRPVGRQPAVHAFKFEPVITAKVRNDVAQLRTELWIENHLRPLKRWAGGYNQHLRVQPYGDNIDSVDQIQAAQAVDKPETETLWFGDITDNYLPGAAANHLLNRTWYSIEGSAVLNGAYGQSLQDQAVHLARAYAGGVTKLIYHIYPYASAPDAHWPGFSTFPNSFGNSWGPRSPEWTDAAGYNAYFARSEQVLKQGTARVDVAVFLQNYLWPQPYTAGGLQYWGDPGLSQSGYTYDYLNPSLLATPAARVTNGVLAAGGPAYKALVIDGMQNPRSAASHSFIPLATARRLLEFARSGLPIIIVGAGPSGVPGLDPQGDSALATVLAELRANPRVHVVATEAEVPGLLRRLDLRPAAEPAAPTTLMSVRRHTPDTDFYWLLNQDRAMPANAPGSILAPAPGKPVDTEVTLSGRGVPLALDPWSGAIHPVTDFKRAGDRVTVRVKLAPGASTILALTTAPGRFGPIAPALVPALAATPLARTADLTVRPWSLALEEWAPANPFATVGPSATRTARTMHNLTLPALKSWSDVPETADASGIGVYSTEWDRPADWRTGRFVLSLGDVRGAFTVRINGRALPFVDQIGAEADVTDYLRPGTNRIEVRVATNLNNRLRVLDPALKDRPRQAYGLIGPVRITATN